MANKLRIIAGGGSPFRVSISGVNVDTAEFNNLIFDANQSPLRLALTGYNEVLIIDNTNTANVFHTISTAVLPTVPAGTTPIFIVITRQRLNPTFFARGPAGDCCTPLFNGAVGSVGGGGGAISDVDGGGVLKFVALSFTRDSPAGTNYGGNNLVNYAIMKNAQ